MKRLLSGLSVTIAALVLFGAVNAFADEYHWTNDTSDRQWTTTGNWEVNGAVPGEPPSSGRDVGDETIINIAGENRAVIADGMDANSGVLQVGNETGTSGELEITGGSLTVFERHQWSSIAQNGTGVVNQSGGDVTMNGNNGMLRIYEGGEWNLSGGSVSEGRQILIDQWDTTTAYEGGLMNITGGSYSATTEVASGEFRVAGSGASSITGGSWTQSEGDLTALFDDGDGIQTIEITGDVSFTGDSRLNLDWVDPSTPVYDTWQLMTWDGSLTDGGLDYHPDVDQDVWSFNLVETGSSGYLEVTAVPEPSSLVLLGIAGLLLMKRRRV